MARVVILGAGVSGHTAALFAKRALGKNHEVVVVTPNSKWNWIPSNIWVGVGQMTRKQVTFPLAPIYKKIGVRYEQAKAVSIHPEGGAEHDKGFVTFTYTSDDKRGETAEIEYDFLINATGPKLKFEATEGLGPEGHTVSVCTDGHAAEANEHLQEAIQRMRNGEHVRFLVGTGNGMCTCQGAGFE